MKHQYRQRTQPRRLRPQYTPSQTDRANAVLPGKLNFRLITEDQVRGGLSKAHFLKYIPYQAPPIAGDATDEAVARHDFDQASHKGTLQAVRAALLSGN